MFCLKLKILFFNLFGPKSYIPKDATQQDLFLSKYPEFDGRGIKIAIIDSGIDLSLEGLQKTSEGLPKIIDCFDFTESGNVETSEIKEIDSKNYLIGLNGKKLKIPKNWQNPSGKWHLGLKTLFTPSKLRTEIPEKLPEIDCIVWFNGEKWCVCIETYKKNLSKAKVLTNFCDEKKYGILTVKKQKMAYCITVKNDGNLLEIYAPYNSHGSTVAQIAAANFPKNPEQNGMAPGAKIISMNILDPASNHQVNIEALKKPLLKCIEMKVDIINYSLSYFSSDKEIENLIHEMCNKYNILIFKGAGNDGPLYSTVSYYDHYVENSIFIIGAILIAEMKKMIFNISIDSCNPPPPPIVYAFSSRGPGGLGSPGMDFVAPGGVVTQMPQFILIHSNYVHGTSCSSPNAAGAVACLLSKLKAKSIKYSPALIKFALFKTAFFPKNENIFEFGHGIIQINSAFDYFCKDVTDFEIHPYITRFGSISFGTDEKTIMEREINLGSFIIVENEHAKKWKLQISKNAENFMKVSKINENNLSFFVKVDTNKLEAGNFYFGEIMILHPKIGSIFNIPVILFYVIKVTESQNYNIQKEITLNYEKPYHIRFYTFFESSNKKCKIKISALENHITNLWLYFASPNSMTAADANKKKKNFKFAPKKLVETLTIPIKENGCFDIIYVKEANNTKKFLVFSRLSSSEKLSIKVNKNEVFDLKSIFCKRSKQY